MPMIFSFILLMSDLVGIDSICVCVSVCFESNLVGVHLNFRFNNPYKVILYFTT